MFIKTNRKDKQEKGITLLALVVTIIILIILATIAINFLFGENGLVTKAQQGRKMHDIEYARERLGTVLADAFSEKKINPDYEPTEFLDKFIKEREPKAEAIEDEISLDGHTFELDRSVPELGEYIGEYGNLPPRIKNINVTNKTYSEVSIEATTVRAEGVKYRFSYKKNDESDYQGSVEQESNTYIISNLETLVIYNVKVDLIKGKDIVDTKTINVRLGELEEGSLTFGETTWSEGTASLSVSTTTSKQIQYQIIPEEGEAGSWIAIANNGSIPNIPNGATVCARLWDGAQGSEEITRTVVDKDAPEITRFEAIETTWNSIKVEVVATDSESGLASTNTYKFYLNDETEVRGTSTDGTYQYTGLTISDKATSYKIRVEVYDNAGNKAEKTLQNVNTKAAIMKIYTKEDMEEFRDIVNSGFTYEGYTVQLMNDIDLQGSEENQWTPVGTTTEFKGTFEGNNHKISNIYINNTSNNQGLFGNFSGIVQNLTVGGTVKGGTNVGGIIGLINQTSNVKIINCANEVNVTSSVSSAGGIVGGIGTSNNIEINKCTNKGNIESLKSNVGGIVGYLGNESKEIIINECSSIGSSISSTDSNAGGIVGVISSIEKNNQKINITNCYNISDINSNIYNSGGIVGEIEKANEVYVYKCCNQSNYVRTLQNSCGGIVGIVSEADCIIEKCYNNSNIIFNTTGGGIVAASINNGKCDVQLSYNTGNITGYSTGGGISGGCTTNAILNISNCYNTGSINNTQYTVRRNSW